MGEISKIYPERMVPTRASNVPVVQEANRIISVALWEAKKEACQAKNKKRIDQIDIFMKSGIKL